MTRLVPALTLALLPLWAGGSAVAGPLTLTDAWIRATPPGARTGAAYLTIENAGAADRLLGGTTPAARGVEIHTHLAEGGVQRMVRLAELTVPGGAAVRLEPGGLHLMLVDIAAPLTAGTRVTLSLQFAMAGTIVVELPVVDARANSPAAHGTH
jgi:hypothetical protein